MRGKEAVENRIRQKFWIFFWLTLFNYLNSSSVFASEQLEAFVKSASMIHSIETDFFQEKRLPILSSPLVSTGRFQFRAPDALRWEYVTPVKSVLKSFKGKTERYLQSDTGALEASGSDASFMDVVLQEISNWMTGRFDQNPMFVLLPGEGNTIVLNPKNDTMASMISKIELIPSDKPGILSEVVIFESPESYTRIRFVNPVINSAIPDTVFTGAP